MKPVPITGMWKVWTAAVMEFSDCVAPVKQRPVTYGRVRNGSKLSQVLSESGTVAIGHGLPTAYNKMVGGNAMGPAADAAGPSRLSGGLCYGLKTKLETPAWNACRT